TAEAQVQVGIPQQPVLRTDVMLPAANGPDSAIVENERLVIQSRQLAKQVVDRLHLDGNPEFNPSLVKPAWWNSFTLPALATKAWNAVFARGAGPASAAIPSANAASPSSEGPSSEAPSPDQMASP